MNNELDNIKRILDKVLSEKYSTFPKEVVFAVLQIQQDCGSDQVEAQKKISAYLTSYFKENPDVTI